MQYLGGKQRIARQITEFLNSVREPGQVYYEPFVGSCAVIQYMDDRGVNLASDAHEALIAMWRELQKGWEPPTKVTEYDYGLAKGGSAPLHLKAFIGFGCSFSAKYFGGYARNAQNKNYALTASNSLKKKMSNMPKVFFFCEDYSKVVPPHRALCYLDPPYAGTTGYSTGKFDHEKFWSTVRDWTTKYECMCYVSEYKAPEDFKCVMEIPTKTSMRTKSGLVSDRVERLFTYEAAS